MGYKDDIERINEMLTMFRNSMPLKEISRSLELYRASLPFQEIARSLQLYNPATMREISKSLEMYRSMSASLRTFQESSALISASMQPVFEQLRFTVSQLGQIPVPKIAIPAENLSRLSELTANFQKLYGLPNIEMPTNTEVDAEEHRRLSWEGLIAIILTIWQILFMHYNDFQDDIKYKQLMIGEQKHTALLEQLVDLEKEKVRLEQERISKEREFEEQLGLLLKTIQPIISENLNDSESDR